MGEGSVNMAKRLHHKLELTTGYHFNDEAGSGKEDAGKTFKKREVSIWWQRGYIITWSSPPRKIPAQGMRRIRARRRSEQLRVGVVASTSPGESDTSGMMQAIVLGDVCWQELWEKEPQ